jgi:hypothetical protein
MNMDVCYKVNGVGRGFGQLVQEINLLQIQQQSYTCTPICAFSPLCSSFRNPRIILSRYIFFLFPHVEACGHAHIGSWVRVR